MDIVVAYDIAETDGVGASRLRRIAQICERYGQRVQFSVFEFRLSPERMARMLGEIQDVIDRDRDSVLVYRFPGRLEDARVRYGRHGVHELGQPWVL